MTKIIESNASAHHASVISGKPEVHSIIFESVFIALNNIKTQRKLILNITPYGEMFLVNCHIKFYIFEKCFNH